MYRDEDDLELLAELAGVLDRTVSDAGLSPGAYLVLRRLVAADGAHPVTGIAELLRAEPAEVADMAQRLVADSLAEVARGGVMATDAGRARAELIETNANEAMRTYVLDRPHTATVYGLVASMQAGRFTVEDLIAFISEAPDTAEGTT